MRKNYIERPRYGTRPKQLLAVKTITNQEGNRRPRVVGDRSTKLVPPSLGSMIDPLSGDKVGYVGPFHGQAGKPLPIPVQTGKVQEHGSQKDVQIAKTVDHALQEQLQHSVPSGTSTISSLPFFSHKSIQHEVRLTLRRGNLQEM